MPANQPFQDVIITATAGEPGLRRGEPVTMGLPWPRGVLFDNTTLMLRDAKDRVTPLQSTVLDHWQDGSIRWLLLDWQAEVNGQAVFKLSAGANGEATEPGMVLTCKKQKDSLLITTGTGRFSVSQGMAACVLRFEPDSPSGTPGVMETHLNVIDEQGQSYIPDIKTLTLEDQGSLRSAACLTGVLRRPSDQTSLAEVIIRINFFAGLSTVRLEVTIRNSRKAEHPGGLWDLGNGGSIYLRDVSVRVSCSQREGSWKGRISPEPGQQPVEFTSQCELYQDSSGGENWNSKNHVNRQGKVPLSFRGYRSSIDGKEQVGLRATPLVEMQSDAHSLGLCVPQFWQNFPKSVEAAPGEITLRLFPRQSADVHEIQGGEQKSHECFIAFGPDRVTNHQLAWARSPLHCSTDPAWYCASEVVPFLTPRCSDPHAEYLKLADAAIEGKDTFAAKREVIDEYGWRHFGDIYGDHEAVFHQGPTPLVSHYNNQYDAVAGLAYQYLRSGNPRWLEEMNYLARHVIDIDIYHTDEDKSAYNHGLFWHTFHYVDALTGTHRSYPKDARVPPDGRPVPGGGPANEQNYATGLMLHYFLTGHRPSREVAIGLAQWVIDMDDGNKTIFRWLSRSDTGLASNSRTPHYHGPGRGAANSIAVLLDGHRLTRDRKYLAKAEQIIRRCIHPSDHIEKHNLLDAENRWFYTMFLQSLGRYLGYKQELDELDDIYAYAQASLLHYARWMLKHEYPYLDKPEILEYPTETWAAQDMRKCEILNLASLYCEDGERSAFRVRADYFFRYATTTLSTMQTRTLCRPVVLMLNYGFAHHWFTEHPEARSAQPSQKQLNFGSPSRFEPQKIIAIRRAKMIIVTASAMFCLGVATLVYWLTR